MRRGIYLGIKSKRNADEERYLPMLMMKETTKEVSHQ